MSIRASLSVPLLLALWMCSGSAAAEPPHAKAKALPKAVHHPERRSDRLDAARTKQERERNVQVLTTVTIVGRPQRPLAVFDINVKPCRFPVGTARYSPRDRRFVPRGRERW